MAARRKETDGPRLTEEWELPAGATLGSSVRAKGILLEMRARLPGAMRRRLDIKGTVLTLSVPESEPEGFQSAASIVSQGLVGIEDLPVIPREIQDILTITSTERHRWLRDGRLPSAGTRTVKLRGRARQITFHVFDPRRVEELLDSGLIDDWREQDAETARENRRRAAWARKLVKAERADKVAPADDGGEQVQLVGWAEFEREGLLR